MDSGFDAVGDVHGQVDALHRLLEKLGYSRNAGGVYAHAASRGSRMALFVGDFIDRGLEQAEVLDIVRKMISAGTAHAVMGNHELNAIAWATPDGQGGHKRQHTDKNRQQHGTFLEQFKEGSSAYEQAIGFFHTLPLWFETPSLRVVHACWHEDSRKDLVAKGICDRFGRVDGDALPRALSRHTVEEHAIDTLLKGPEMLLPHGRSFHDKDGHLREHVRLRWWDPEATTFRKAAIVMDDGLGELPEDEVPDTYTYKGTVPVVFGHYWMRGEPFLTGAKAACIDFSVAKPEGSLTSYRFSGEASLTESNLVHVPAMEERPLPSI